MVVAKGMRRTVSRPNALLVMYIERNKKKRGRSWCESHLDHRGLLLVCVDGFVEIGNYRMDVM